MKRYLNHFSIAMLSIYASDLHKLLINTMAFITGQPLKLQNLASQLDIFMSGICLFLILIHIMKNNRTLNRLINIPTWSQILILLLLTISLIEYRGSLSIKYYYQFIGGNMVLYFGGLLISKDIDDINIIFKIWIFTTFIISIISIYMFSIGATYLSARAAIIPGMDFRSGYACSISIIYLVINEKHIRKDFGKKENIFYMIFVSMLLFAVITSGSKISFILLVLILLSYYMFFVKKNIRGLIYIFISILVMSIILYYIFSANRGKYGMNIFEFNQYIISYQSRINIFLDYVKKGLKAPFTGQGIGSSYILGETHRTHSVITSFFIQIGLFGLVSYIMFLVSIFLKGKNLIKNRAINERKKKLIISLILIFIFAVIFGEVASDIPGNRFLWLFGSLILVFKDDMQIRYK